MSCQQPRCHFAQPSLAYSEAGSGETVLLLHGSTSSGAMWRRLIVALQPGYRVVAPDLTGYGRSAPWPAGAEYTIAAEARGMKPLLPYCESYHLVGHSFGGLIALQLALGNPARVRTLTLIEPVFVAVLRSTDPNDAYETFAAQRARFDANLKSGDRAGAMRDFITFWSGEGAWEGLNGAAQSAMRAMADQVALDWHAAFSFAPRTEYLQFIADRTMIVGGDRSPLPMQRLVDALHRLMAGSARVVVPDATHLLPLTHSAELIAAVLAQLHADAERRQR